MVHTIEGCIDCFDLPFQAHRYQQMLLPPAVYSQTESVCHWMSVVASTGPQN